MDQIRIIARHHGGIPQKFGIPRQSGLTSIESMVIFEHDFSNPDAIRGLENFSHIWLLWIFSLNKKSRNSLTVRPPRLGGNRRIGVFATRSPYRPNPIGMSCVRLLSVDYNDNLGISLRISGADLADDTPIIDIKPYIPYADAILDAKAGFATDPPKRMNVDIPATLASSLPDDIRKNLISILECDPRPAYHESHERVYAFEFSGWNVKFKASKDTVFVEGINKNKELT